MNKLDLIIDALEELMHSNSTGIAAAKFSKALAAARELRALEPTHYVDHKNERNVVHYSLWESFDDCGILRERYTTPLYTLDEVTK